MGVLLYNPITNEPYHSIPQHLEDEDTRSKRARWMALEEVQGLTKNILPHPPPLTSFPRRTDPMLSDAHAHLPSGPTAVLPVTSSTVHSKPTPPYGFHSGREVSSQVYRLREGIGSSSHSMTAASAGTLDNRWSHLDVSLGNSSASGSFSSRHTTRAGHGALCTPPYQLPSYSTKPMVCPPIMASAPSHQPALSPAAIGNEGCLNGLTSTTNRIRLSSPPMYLKTESASLTSENADIGSGSGSIIRLDSPKSRTVAPSGAFAVPCTPLGETEPDAPIRSLDRQTLPISALVHAASRAQSAVGGAQMPHHATITAFQTGPQAQILMHPMVVSTCVGYPQVQGQREASAYHVPALHPSAGVGFTYDTASREVHGLNAPHHEYESNGYMHAMSAAYSPPPMFVGTVSGGSSISSGDHVTSGGFRHSRPVGSFASGQPANIQHHSVQAVSMGRHSNPPHVLFLVCQSPQRVGYPMSFGNVPSDVGMHGWPQ